MADRAEIDAYFDRMKAIEWKRGQVAYIKGSGSSPHYEVCILEDLGDRVRAEYRPQHKMVAEELDKTAIHPTVEALKDHEARVFAALGESLVTKVSPGKAFKTD